MPLVFEVRGNGIAAILRRATAPADELSTMKEKGYPACVGAPILKKCAEFREN